MLADWNGPELDAGLPPHELERSFDTVRRLIGASVQCGVRANPNVTKLPPKAAQPVMANLHVCDASVFPTAITVNPQLTVTALAHYGAGAIA